MSVVGFLPFFDGFFGLLCVGGGSVFGFTFVLLATMVFVLTLAVAFALAFALVFEFFEFFECTEPDVDGLE